jgi:single-stranded DNA-binding protein
VTPGNADQQETLWLSVLAFGRQAEALLRHKQGDLVSMSGKVTQSRWTGQDGTGREQLRIIAESVISARTARPGGGRKANQGQGTTHAHNGAQGFQAPPPFDDPIGF